MRFALLASYRLNEVYFAGITSFEFNAELKIVLSSMLKNQYFGSNLMLFAGVKRWIKWHFKETYTKITIE